MQAKRNGSASSSAGTNIDQTLLLKDFFNSQLSREQQQRQKSSSSAQRDQKNNTNNNNNKRSNKGNNHRSQHDRQSSSPSNKKNNRRNDDLITFLIQKAASKQQQYQPPSSSTSTIHEMSGSSNSSHGTTPDEQELFRKQRLAYIRELRSQVLPPQDLKSANQYSLVHSTVRFFEQNLSYFVEHPIEFQRLVSQLRTRQERTLFLQTIYMYYYPDVLHELRRLKMRSMTEQKQQQKQQRQQKIRTKQNSKDNERDDDVNEQKLSERSVNLLMKQYRNEQQLLSEKELQEQEKKRTKKNTYDEERTMPCSAQKQNIDLNKVKHVYRFIQNFDSSFAVPSVVDLSNVACFEPFYRLILELNSSEALCLEAMLSVVNN